MYKQLDGVIFDLDGTLIDSMGVWAQVDVEFLQHHGHEAPPDLFDDLEGGNSFEEVADYMRRKFDLQLTNAEIMAEWTEMVAEHYRHSVPLKPGVREFLSRLRAAGIPMGVGTSNNAALASAALAAHGVLDWFGCLVTGGGDLRGKPFPDVFLEAARRLNVDPRRCIVVEDVLAGVQAGVAAGATVLAVKDESAQREWCEIANTARILAEDFYEIAEWVELRYKI